MTTHSHNVKGSRHRPGLGTTYHAEVRQKVRVALQLPRVLVKVLVGPELGRVDEDAGHHHVVVLPRLPDQPQVPCEWVEETAQVVLNVCGG
jgi:hypothetical protein